METATRIDELFTPITDAVEQFAAAQSFRIDKCARGNKGWELTRQHPLAGTIYLLLLHDAALGLGIGSVWQFPCPEMSLVYSHFRAMRACSMQPSTVVDALAVESQQINQVKFGYWTHMSPLQPEKPACVNKS